MSLIHEVKQLYPKFLWIEESFRHSSTEIVSLKLPLKHSLYNDKDNYLVLTITKKGDEDYYGDIKIMFTVFYMVKTKIYDVVGYSAKDIIENCIEGLKNFTLSLTDAIVDLKTGETTTT